MQIFLFQDSESVSFENVLRLLCKSGVTSPKWNVYVGDDFNYLRIGEKPASIYH